jgi:hypothetical protein
LQSAHLEAIRKASHGKAPSWPAFAVLTNTIER